MYGYVVTLWLVLENKDEIRMLPNQISHDTRNSLVIAVQLYMSINRLVRYRKRTFVKCLTKYIYIKKYVYMSKLYNIKSVCKILIINEMARKHTY